MNFEGLPQFLKPTLRLFLSIDLVGSTALKQAGSFPLDAPAENDPLADVGAEWFNEVAGFYRDIEIEFSREWQHYRESVAKKYVWPDGQDPFLWKSNGDEVIYVKELTESRECYAAVVCWINVVHTYRKKLKARKSPLDVKAAVWVAGFPIANSEVIFSTSVGERVFPLDIGIPKVTHYYLLDKWYSGDKEGLVRDFIGPSMDTGFRVSSKATPRKCTLSMEAALLLSLVTPPEEYENKIVIRYDGRETLKGVLGGRPYPLFWADTHLNDRLSSLEDQLRGPKSQDAAHVRQFCTEFIKSHETYLFRPFIHQSTEPLLSIVPENYGELLHHISRQWAKEKNKLEIEIRSLHGESPENDQGNSVEVGEDEASEFTSGLLTRTPDDQAN